MKTFIIPGVYGSGPDHWQTWIEKHEKRVVRVNQPDWSKPSLIEWSKNLAKALEASDEPVWLIAHSFGCLISVMAGVACPEKVAGLFLVAPANPKRFTLNDFAENDPHGTSASRFLPDTRLPFPALVVASENDPWMPIAKAQYWADKWGARFVNAGKAGHINAEAGYSEWQDGLDMFKEFKAFHEMLQQLEKWQPINTMFSFTDQQLIFKDIALNNDIYWEGRSENNYLHA